MKTLILASLAVAIAIGLSGCGPAEAKTDERPPENGAQFKKEQGVTLTDAMKKAIGLRVAEVGEQKIAPSFSATLHVVGSAGAGNNEASGWLTTQQAALLKPGMEIEVRADTPGAAMEKATVLRVEKAPYATLGDYEVSVAPASRFEAGARIVAQFRAPAGEAVTAIPREALLKTAEGTFVYAANGFYYVHTPVKVGAMSAESVEITDGLYSGDQIVVSPVMSLWLAELQVLRGGKACTCGH